MSGPTRPINWSDRASLPAHLADADASITALREVIDAAKDLLQEDPPISDRNRTIVERYVEDRSGELGRWEARAALLRLAHTPRHQPSGPAYV